MSVSRPSAIVPYIKLRVKISHPFFTTKYHLHPLLLKMITLTHTHTRYNTLNPVYGSERNQNVTDLG